MGQRFGIDVSHWQGNFNFANAKNNEGVEFAIIKAGGGDLSYEASWNESGCNCKKVK